MIIGLISPSWPLAALGGIAVGAGFILLTIPHAGLVVWIGFCLAAPVWALVAYTGKRLFQR